MNLEFVLSVSFGLGVAGAFSRLFLTPETNLVSRVMGKVEYQNPSALGSLLVNTKAVVSRARSRNSAKLERALFELPEIIDLLVVSLRSGEGIYKSFATVTPRCEGEVAKQLERALLSVEYGAAFGTEIRSVAEALSHPQVSEFSNKVALSLERGTPLAQMLQEQGESVRAEIRNRLLRQAGKNETRMLIPLVFLILPITVLFAIYPSLKLLNFGFI